MDNLARKMTYGATYEGGVKCSRTTGRPFYQVEVADDRVFKQAKSDIKVAGFVNDACKERVRQKRKKENAKKKEVAEVVTAIIFILMVLISCIQPPM